jgi:hypothetical protein
MILVVKDLRVDQGSAQYLGLLAASLRADSVVAASRPGTRLPRIDKSYATRALRPGNVDRPLAVRSQAGPPDCRVIGRDSSSCFLEAVWDGRILHGGEAA